MNKVHAEFSVLLKRVLGKTSRIIIGAAIVFSLMPAAQAFAVSPKPDLTVTKTNNLGGGNAIVGTPFQWKLHVSNSGSSTASFGNNDVALTDNLPSSGATYSNPTVSTSSTSGTVTCTLAGSDISCQSGTGSNKLSMLVNSFFDVFIAVTPTNLGSLVNPRSTGNNPICKVNPNGDINESNGNNNTCSDTVTVIANTGTIIVKKVMVGGTATFVFTGNASGSISTNNGTISATIASGTYTSTETLVAGWSLTGVSCDDSDSVGSIGNHNATFHLSAGETVTCTFTNTKHGTIHVTKTTVPANNTTQFTIDASSSNGGVVTAPAHRTSLATNHAEDFDVTPATYSVAETVPAGWSKTSDTCQGLVVAAGATANCNVTNTKLANLHIVKSTVPHRAGGVFPFNVHGANYNANQSIEGEDGVNFTNLVPGAYNITETVPGGWDFTSAFCGNDGEEQIQNGGSYTLEPGENATCTFTDTKRGSVTITKIARPVSDGPFIFTLKGASNPDPVTYTDGSFSDEDNGASEGVSYTFDNLIPGSGYSVSEQVPEEWSGQRSSLCTSDGESVDPASFTLPAGGNVSCTFNNTQYGSITGRKFNDLDANGSNTENSYLSGWTITLAGDSLDGATTTVTNKNGTYAFGGLLPGTYHVCESMQQGWHQSYPKENYDCDGTRGYEVPLSDGGQNVSGKDFGNYEDGSISGTKFNDLNGDGRRGDGEGGGNEPGLANWQIALYSSGEGQTLLTTTTTNESGQYSFGALKPGTYVVKEINQNNWIETTPQDPNSHTVTISSGDEKTGYDFGNVHMNALITGVKFRDDNQNGVRDEGEAGVPGWTVALGKVLKPQGETSTVPIEIVALSLTGTDGGFSLPVTEPGNYKVFEESRDGWHPTAPAPRVDSFFDITYRIDLAGSPPPLNANSFFDVFTELSNNNINTDVHENPLWFGNFQEPTTPPDPNANPHPTWSYSVSGGGCSGEGCGPQGGNGGGGNSGGGQVLGVSTTTEPTPPPPPPPPSPTPPPPTPPPSPSAAPCVDYLTKQLSYGHRFTQDPADVRKLQRFLNKFEGASVPVSGFYGRLTRAAVRAFQLKHKDVIAGANGNVNEPTRKLMNKINCSALAAGLPDGLSPCAANIPAGEVNDCKPNVY